MVSGGSSVFGIGVDVDLAVLVGVTAVLVTAAAHVYPRVVT
jgi:hypothetical protein